MSMFGKLTTDGLEDAQDRAGGGFIRESGIAVGTIKLMYGITSTAGAKGVVCIFDFDGQEYRETVYVTKQTGENFYHPKDKDGKEDKTKKAPLPGFTLIDDICLLASDKPLCEQTEEAKMVNIWDNDAKKELPKSVPVLTDMTGLAVAVGIVKSTENKNEKDGVGGYQATAEIVERNSMDKAFHPEARVTVSEAKAAAEKNEQPESKFWEVWEKKNKGITRDKTTFGKTGGVKAGAPGKAGTAPVAGATATAPRKSLFGNKAA